MNESSATRFVKLYKEEISKAQKDVCDFSKSLSTLSRDRPLLFRSSHQRCSVKVGLLRNFTKFTGKQLSQALFFDKVASLKPATLLKKRLWHMYFLVNFLKFIRTPFLLNTSGRLLLTFGRFTLDCSKIFACSLEKRRISVFYHYNISSERIDCT